MSREIPLQRGLVAIVDDDVYDRVSGYHWHAHWRGHSYYVCRKIKTPEGKWIQTHLHSEVLPTLPGFRPDHIDGNGLNNLRDNLRPLSKSGNAGAFITPRKGKTSRFRGVCFTTRERRWMAQLTFQYRKIHLGLFDDEESAARARDAASLQYFGASAQLNFPK